MDRQSTIIATGADPASLGLTLGEISALMERRLSWYGLSRITLDAVELKDGKAIVAHLSDATKTAYREVIDVQTGRLVKREVLRTRSAGASADISAPSQRTLPES